jgi:hypothetical protein
LFVYAKDLFVEANDGPLAPLHCWLTNRKNIPTAINNRNQNTDNERGNPMPTLDGLRPSAFLRCSDA